MGPLRLTATVSSVVSLRVGAIGTGFTRAAVKQFPTAVFERREDQRGRDRGADRVEQLAFAQPHLLTRGEVGCDRRERYGQILDGEIADQLAQYAYDALALEKPGPTECRIEQAHHLHALERQHPLGINFEFARSVDSPDERAHGGARDRANVVAVPGQPLNDADVGQAAGAAAAENERYRCRMCHYLPKRLLLLEPDSSDWAEGSPSSTCATSLGYPRRWDPRKRGTYMHIKDLYSVIVTDKRVECRDFYVRWFGFQVVFEASWFVYLAAAGDHPFGIAFMAPDHPSQPPGPERFSGQGMFITVQVEDAAAEFERLTRGGLDDGVSTAG